DRACCGPSGEIVANDLEVIDGYVRELWAPGAMRTHLPSCTRWLTRQADRHAASYRVTSARDEAADGYRWSDEYGARLGLMRRGEASAAVRWFEIEPCYVFHVLNAYEDEHGGVVIDVARYPELWRSGFSGPPAALRPGRMDIAGGRVSEQGMDDRAIEFPRFDERRVGGLYQYAYAVHTPRGANHALGTSLIKYDLRDDVSATHDFGPGRVPAEPLFVPASPS